MRVHELAKKLKVTSKEVIEACGKKGIDVKNHMSSLDDKQVKDIKDFFKKKKSKKIETKKKDKKTSSSKTKKKVSKTKKKSEKTEDKGVKKTSEKTKKKTTDKKKSSKTKTEKTKTGSKKPEKEQSEEDESQLSEEEELLERHKKVKWDEEKKINIQKVLARELDREEKEGRVRFRPKRDAKKKASEVKAKKKKDDTKGSKTQARPTIKKVLELPEGITIKQLSEMINIPSSDLIQSLFNMGEVVTLNQPLDKDLIEFLSEEKKFKYRMINFEERDEDIFDDKDEDLVIRPPIVTVMGHVDHGKTTLLDSIREADVVQGETGGITQKIGAYQAVHDKRKITFVDTPGHEAFTNMRARGAKVTDIAIIVVAADDGVMPQTVEAINHAKEAEVPIIVAINKIDLPNANPEKIKQGLTEYSLVPEEWGGDTVFVEISAKNKVNIDGLLEMILLVADLHEIKGNPNADASGIIIESRLDKGMGAVGTVLIKRGSLKKSDFFVTGNSYGRVRTLKDEKGQQIKKATLSDPVEVSGFSKLPQAGDKFFAVKNEKMAKNIISKRDHEYRMAQYAKSRKHISLEDLAQISGEDEIRNLKIILKSESIGSLDAVEKSLKDIEKNEEGVSIELIHKAVGAISDSDIDLATASDAVVIGFGVAVMPQAIKIAKEEKVDVRTYDIIYKLIDDVESAFKGMLEPEIKEIMSGRVEIREVFKLPKIGIVAGCYVQEGEVNRGDKVKLVRDGKIIYESVISSLQRFKDSVKNVSAGYECGIKVENYQDYEKGDILEVYTTEEVEK